MTPTVVLRQLNVLRLFYVRPWKPARFEIFPFFPLFMQYTPQSPATKCGGNPSRKLLKPRKSNRCRWVKYASTHVFYGCSYNRCILVLRRIERQKKTQKKTSVRGARWTRHLGGWKPLRLEVSALLAPRSGLQKPHLIK